MRLSIATETRWPVSLQGLVGHPSHFQRLTSLKNICRNRSKTVDTITISGYGLGMKTKKTKTVQGKVEVLRETEKAFQVDFGSGMGGMMWLPKSQIIVADGIVTMPAWLFRGKLMDNQMAYNNLTSDQKAQNAGYRSADHFMSTQNH